MIVHTLFPAKSNEHTGQDLARFPVFKKFIMPLLVCGLIFIGYALIHFYLCGYLPAPFWFDARDSFMDFFHTNYWAFQEGRYSEWHSIYPLPVFLIAKLITNPVCAEGSAFLMRSCDTPSVWILFGSYVIGSGLSTMLFVKEAGLSGVSWCGKLIIYFSFLFCLPGLFALERGNYIVMALMFIAAAKLFGGRWQGALCMAIAINIKQYLLVLLLLPFLSRKFIYLGWVVVFGLLINFIAYLVIPDPNYRLLPDNMLSFSGVGGYNYFHKMWYSTSLFSWLNKYNGPGHAVWMLMGINLASVLRQSVVLLVKLGLLLMVLRGLRRVFTEAVDLFADSRAWLAVLMGLFILNDSPGGYAFLLLLPFVGVMCKTQPNIWVFSCLLLIFMPLDIVLTHNYSIGEQLSYLSGVQFEAQTGLTIGARLRPLILITLFWMLCFPKIKFTKSETRDSIK